MPKNRGYSRIERTREVKGAGPRGGMDGRDAVIYEQSPPVRFPSRPAPSPLYPISAFPSARPHPHQHPTQMSPRFHDDANVLSSHLVTEHQRQSNILQLLQARSRPPRSNAAAQCRGTRVLWSCKSRHESLHAQLRGVPLSACMDIYLKATGD